MCTTTCHSCSHEDYYFRRSLSRPFRRRHERDHSPAWTAVRPACPLAHNQLALTQPCSSGSAQALVQAQAHQAQAQAYAAQASALAVHEAAQASVPIAYQAASVPVALGLPAAVGLPVGVGVHGATHLVNQSLLTTVAPVSAPLALLAAPPTPLCGRAAAHSCHQSTCVSFPPNNRYRRQNQLEEIC